MTDNPGDDSRHLGAGGARGDAIQGLAARYSTFHGAEPCSNASTARSQSPLILRAYAEGARGVLLVAPRSCGLSGDVGRSIAGRLELARLRCAVIDPEHAAVDPRDAFATMRALASALEPAGSSDATV